MRQLLWLLMVGLANVGLASGAFGQAVQGCGSLENAYGPFDYTNPQHVKFKLPIVESGHFDAGVEALRGHARHPQNLAGDIDYTLRAFPNHSRALYAMVRYELSRRDYKRKRLRYSAECYLRRAIAFAPNDGAVRMIYGLYLYKLGKMEEAKQRFQEALTLSPDSAEVNYNLGLVMVETGDYAQAKELAVRAYELGYPLGGLRNKLKRAGAW